MADSRERPWQEGPIPVGLSISLARGRGSQGTLYRGALHYAPLALPGCPGRPRAWEYRNLRAWIDRNLAAASGAAWSFVAFHHPGFNSSKAHFNDQQMRLLADLFEARGVDVVFAGHVHNYQRTFPLRFTVDVWSDGRPLRDQDRVPGRWILDKSFDGQSHTHPQGVIYLVTGAGGNTLYNPEQQDDPSSWQSFTTKFISKVNSLTLADVSGTTLTVRQVSDTGDRAGPIRRDEVKRARARREQHPSGKPNELADSHSGRRVSWRGEPLPLICGRRLRSSRPSLPGARLPGCAQV